VKTKNRIGGLADAVAERVRPAKPVTWIDRLAPDDQAGVHEIRKRFQAGGYGIASAASVARALREEAIASGWHIVSEKEIAEWLRKN
jgi:hypothetical protein